RVCKDVSSPGHVAAGPRAAELRARLRHVGAGGLAVRRGDQRHRTQCPLRFRYLWRPMDPVLLNQAGLEQEAEKGQPLLAPRAAQDRANAFARTYRAPGHVAAGPRAAELRARL